MKRFALLFAGILLAAMTILPSCSKEEEASGDESEPKAGAFVPLSVTLNDVSNLTEVEVKLNAFVNMNENSEYSTMALVYYSTWQNNESDLKSGGRKFGGRLFEDGRIDIVLRPISPATKYHYVIVVTIDGVDITSPVGSFETPNFSLKAETGAADVRTSTMAQVFGKFSITSKADLSPSFYFCYSPFFSKAEELGENGQQSKATFFFDNYISRLSPLQPGTKYFYVACAEAAGRKVFGSVKSFETPGVPEDGDLVDFGFGVKWRRWNLGASKPEEVGGLYQWPGPEDPESHEYSMDVVQAELGGSWHVPSVEDWMQLWENCNWTWTESYKDTGVSGVVVSSKMTGAGIFIPDEPRYWTSTRDTINTQNAFSARVIQQGFGGTRSENCRNKLAIRPVTD